MVIVAEVPCRDSRALVYEFGWQSWSPSTVYRGSRRHGYLPSAPTHNAFRVDRPRTPYEFQGDGLLAIEPEPGAPVRVFMAEDARLDVPAIRARYVDDRFVVTADGPVIEDTYVSTGGERSTMNAALAKAAVAYVERTEPVTVRRIPRLWASWYQYYTEFSEADLIENLDAMDELELPVDIVRIDDAFQSEIGDWLTSNGRFESIPVMVKRVRDHGREVGIWTAPFVVGENSQTFADHPEWCLHDIHGEPVCALYNWGQLCFALDMTRPDVRDHLCGVFDTFRAYGVSYFMTDFAYAASMFGQYQNPMPALAVYRSALELVREAIGPDAYLQGCGAPMFPSIGLVDSMRISPDTAPHYLPIDGNMSEPGQVSANCGIIGRAFTHGRFWAADPDCFMVRPEIQNRFELSRIIAEYGGVRISSDRLRNLDRWGLDRTRELLTITEPEPFRTEQIDLYNPAEGIDLQS